MPRNVWILTVTAASIVGLGGCGKSSEGLSLRDQVAAATQEANPERRATRLIGLAAKQYEAQDLGGADSTLHDATDAIEHIKGPAFRARLYGSLAETQARGGNLSDGRRSLDKARHAAEEADPDERTALLARAAVIEGTALNDVAAAQKLLDAAAKSAASIRDAESRLSSLLDVSDAYRELRLEAEAEATLKTALSTAEKLDDASKRSAALGRIATAEVRLAHPEQADTLFQQAIAAARQVESPYSKAYDLIEIGSRMASAKRFAEARQVLKEAEAVAKQVTDVALQNQIGARLMSARLKMPSS